MRPIAVRTQPSRGAKPGAVARCVARSGAMQLGLALVAALERSLRSLRAVVPVICIPLLYSLPVGADGAEIPASVLARLLTKIPAYDRGFRERARPLVQVLILTNPGEAESVRAATLMQSALLREQTIAGLPHDAFVHVFRDAGSLALEVRRRQVSIVYVTPGLSDQLEAICGALEPLGVLTMATVPEYVERCVVVGFQLLGGHPKIFVHLAHAQLSGVHFRSELLELAQVYR